MAIKRGKDVEVVRKGRRVLGGIYNLGGVKAYFAYRKQKDIFRGGEKTIAEAVAKGVACWAIDDETLLMLRANAIGVVGVMVSDTGDRYVTKTANFFDKTKASLLNYEARGGALQRYLPIQHFVYRAGK